MLDTVLNCTPEHERFTLNFTLETIKKAIADYYQSQYWFIDIIQQFNTGLVDDEVVFLERFYNQASKQSKGLDRSISLNELEELCNGLYQYDGKNSALMSVKRQLCNLLTSGSICSLRQISLLLRYLKQINLLSIEILTQLAPKTPLMGRILDFVESIIYFNLNTEQFRKLLTNSEGLDSALKSMQFFHSKQLKNPALIELILSHAVPFELAEVGFTLFKLGLLNDYLEGLKDAQLPQLKIITILDSLSQSPIVWSQRTCLNKSNLNFIFSHQQPHNLLAFIELWTSLSNDILTAINFNDLITYSELLTHSDVIKLFEKQPKSFFNQQAFDSVVQFCKTTTLEYFEEVIPELEKTINSKSVDFVKTRKHPYVETLSFIQNISTETNLPNEVIQLTIK